MSKQATPRWSAEDDAVLAPYLAGKMTLEIARVIGPRIGRTPQAVVARHRLLTKPHVVRVRHDRVRVRPRVTKAEALPWMRERKCSLCRNPFSYDPRRENFFRCELHRGGDSWMAEGGSSGGRVGGRRAL